MPNCEEYQTLISTLLDHENTEEELAALIEHLASCEDCKTYLSDQILIHNTMQGLSCKAPDGFTEGVMARVHGTKQELPEPAPEKSPESPAEEKKTIAFPRRMRWAGLAACCAVILAGVWFAEFGSMSMSAVANSAAPQMGYRIEAPAEASETAESSAEYRREGSETASAESAPCSEGAGEESALTQMADSSVGSDCVGQTDYAVQLTTGSADAAAWVERTLRESWVSGTVYEITREQYEEVTALLNAQDAAFTVLVGAEDSTRYLLCAK